MRRYARTRRRIIYCPRESHGAAALFAAGRNIRRRARWFLARPAPLRLGLLIVLELLVRRIIELRLLPRVMKVDGPWGPRRSHPDHASARRLMKTKTPCEMPLSKRFPSGGRYGSIASSVSPLSPPLRFLMDGYCEKLFVLPCNFPPATFAQRSGTPPAIRINRLIELR